ncbi:hypothetical protein BJY04DRAFT_33312 [Aspergillus karnatakaensis]|uniref:uncharacterized protein n=1 Tax=Aspergillus karnatakaensis TaxID=1810916 RepID=UPI003CCDE836
MSTQSPTPLTPKGPRNNRRNQRKPATPSVQNVPSPATPPSSPPRAVSPRETATDSSGAMIMSKKKGSRSARKPRDVSKTSPVNKPSHRHTTSHPNNHITTPQLKDTHYAGPTFHASPAPSALPIPSFFSKSFPDSDLAPTLEQDNDSFDVDADVENTPSKTKSRPSISPEKRESTPLDFLFKAAVESRKSEIQRSPGSSPRVQSPQTDSKAIQRRKFNGESNGMFSLELGSSDLHHSQIGPSFAPSYKDRMNALRSASSPSPILQDLDEDERKAKTAALKSLLLNPPPQRPLSVSQSHYSQFDHNQERPALSPVVPHYATPMRTSSGPPMVSSHGDPIGRNPPHSSYWPQPGPHNAQLMSPQQQHPRDHTSGNGVLASHAGNTPVTLRQPYGSPSSAYPYSKFPTSQQSPGYYSQLHSKSPVSQNLPTNAKTLALDTKRMEDDLRRILKIDGSSGLPSNGIQSSLA